MAFNSATGQMEPDAPAQAPAPVNPAPAATAEKPYWVKKKDGSFMAVHTPEDLQAAANEGDTIATDDELSAEHRRVASDSALGHVTAGLFSALDTAGFGLPGLAIRKMAPEVYKDVKASQEENPVTSFVGSAAGVLADPFGGAALTAKVGGAAERGTAALLERSAAKHAAEAAASEGAEAVIPSLAERILSKTGSYVKDVSPRFMDNAVQGSIYGAGQLVSEGDLGATPEEVAGHVALILGGSAVLGGVGGELIHGVFSGLLPKPVTELKEATQKSGNAIRDLYSTVREKFPAFLGKETKETLAAKTQLAEHQLRSEEAAAAQGHVLKNTTAGTEKPYEINLLDKKAVDQASEHVATTMGDTHALSEATTDHLNEDLLPAAAKRNLSSAPMTADIAKAVEGVLDKGLGTAEHPGGLIGQPASEATGAQVEGLHLADDQTLARDVKRAYQRYEAAAMPLGVDGSPVIHNSPTDHWLQLDKLNRELKAEKVARMKDPHPADIGPLNALSEVISAHDAILADPHLWGEAQASLMTEQNRLYAEGIPLRQSMRKALFSDTGKYAQPSSSKFATLVKQGGTYGKSDVLDNLNKYQEWVEKQHTFAEKVAKGVDSPAAAVEGLGKKARAQMEEARNAISMAGQVQDQWTAVQGQLAKAAAGPLSNWNKYALLLAALGHHAMGATGLAFSAATKFTDANYMLMALTKLGRAMAKQDSSLKGAAGALIKGSTAVGEWGLTKGARVGPLAGSLWTVDEYRDHVKKVGNLVNNPEAVLGHLESQAGDLHAVAPQAYTALAQHRGTALQALNQALQGPQMQGFLPKEYTPSATELAKMQTTAEIIKNPNLAVRMALAGVLTPAMVQTWGKVHPTHFQAFQTHVTHELAQLTKHDTLSLKAMNTMAAMGMGPPTGAYSQPALFRVQSIYASQRAALGGPGQHSGAGSRGGEPSKLKQADEMLLPGQRAANRSAQVR